MKRFILIFVAIANVSIVNAGIQWEYDSKIIVNETITETGSGDYLYEYSLTNNDTSVIWDFVLYTYFDSQPTNTYKWKSDWTTPQTYEYLFISDYYDMSSVDQDVTGGLWTSYEYWAPNSGEVDGIQVGDTVTVMSYVTNVYDPSTKYYCYTTIETNGTGPYLQDTVTGLGETVPEPTSIALLALGGLLFRKRKIIN